MVNGPDGIGMINPTSSGGEVWYLETNPIDDPRFNINGALSGDYSIGFWSNDNLLEMTVETSVGYNPGGVIRNISHSFIDSAGFMYKSNDWRDVEITGYFNAQDVFNESAMIQLLARSAELPSNTTQWCPGSFYMGELARDGRFRWTKGQYHMSYDSKEWIPASNVGLGENLQVIGWFGLKIVLTNMDAGEDGKQGVSLAAYVDPLDNNTWHKIITSDILDIGDWGADGEECGGAADQIITWGGPLITFRILNGGGLKWKKLSGREIDIAGDFLNPQPTRQAPAFAAASRVLTSTRHLYRIGTFIAPTCIGEIPSDPDPDPPDPPPDDPTPPEEIEVLKKIGHKYTLNKARTAVETLSAMVSAAVKGGTVEAPES